MRASFPDGSEPSAATGERSPGGSFGADAFGLQVPIQETGSLSLVDDNRPEAATDVSVDRPKSAGGFRCTDPEVRHPSTQIAAEFIHTGGERTPPVWRCHRPDGGPSAVVPLSPTTGRPFR